jgi:hypothetical protein
VPAAMGTLNPIGEGSPLSATPNGGVAGAGEGQQPGQEGARRSGQEGRPPATPPSDRDYSGVGGGTS